MSMAYLEKSEANSVTPRESTGTDYGWRMEEKKSYFQAPGTLRHLKRLNQNNREYHPTPHYPPPG